MFVRPKLKLVLFVNELLVLVSLRRTFLLLLLSIVCICMYRASLAFTEPCILYAFYVLYNICAAI